MLQKYKRCTNPNTGICPLFPLVLIFVPLCCLGTWIERSWHFQA